MQRRTAQRAYANNEANFSVTSMNIDRPSPCLTSSSTSLRASPRLPARSSTPSLVGKLAFFTRPRHPRQRDLRHPDPRVHSAEFPRQAVEGRLEQLRLLPSGRARGRRNLVLRHRAAPDQTAGRHVRQGQPGRSGPRSTGAPCRGSNTDFNANSRVTQGGCGFASDDFRPRRSVLPRGTRRGEPGHLRPRDHAGGSDALDAQTLWIFAAVRPLKQPQPVDTAAHSSRRRTVFQTQLRLLPRGRQVDEEPDLPPRQPRCRRQNGAPLDPGVIRPRQRVQDRSPAEPSRTSPSTTLKILGRSISTTRWRSVT